MFVQVKTTTMFMGRKISENFTKLSLSRPEPNHLVIVTKNNFIKRGEHYVVKTMEDRIEISRPTIDYNGRLIKASYTRKDYPEWSRLSLACQFDYELGSFEPDPEESNEDKLVINLNN